MNPSQAHPPLTSLTSRRTFLGASAAASLTWAAPGLRDARREAPRDGQIRLGLISDVHQDVMHDGEERLQAFVSAMEDSKVQGIVNLGDFCVPHDRNRRFMEIWNAFSGSSWHVIGNHDTDGGYRREQTVEYYGMPARYYSQDHQGLHLVVLDGNDPDGKPGYPCHVNDQQLEWLEKDLANTKLPTLIMIHQPIDAYDKHVRGAAKVRSVLANANRDASFPKVIGVFSGHAHLDYVLESDGIPHFQINSASYVWVDKKHLNYPEDIQAKHPWVAATCPYKDPLWAVVTLDTVAGEIRLEGRTSTWVGPDPWEVGLAEDDYQRSRMLCRPGITGRVWRRS